MDDFENIDVMEARAIVWLLLLAVIVGIFMGCATNSKGYWQSIEPVKLAERISESSIPDNYRLMFAGKILRRDGQCKIETDKSNRILHYVCPEFGEGDIKFTEGPILTERSPEDLERWIKHNLPAEEGFFDCEEWADVAVIHLKEWGYEIKRNFYSPAKANGSKYRVMKLTRHVDVAWKKNGKTGRILQVF